MTAAASVEPLNADGSPMPVVYQFDTDLNRKPWLNEPGRREPLLRFLHAHDLRLRFVMGTRILVRLHADDTLWLHTRRATGEAPDGFEMCPYCEFCVKTTVWVVPLAAPVPYGSAEEAFVKSGYGDRLTSPDPNAGRRPGENAGG